MKTMLITGATSGIGKALAEHAAKSGYRVIACGRNSEVLNELQSQYDIIPCEFDVTNADDCREALCNKEYDIAILNAGTCEYVEIDEFEPAMFRRVFEPNFFGVVNCVDALRATFKEGQQLVIVDSMARLFPFTRTEAYGASKAALHYFTKSLEVDLYDKGVRVQAVSPGFVETPLTEKNDFDMPMKITAQEAAEALLNGIEKKKPTIFFPTGFGLIMRFLHILPTFLQRKLSLSIRNKQ